MNKNKLITLGILVLVVGLIAGLMGYSAHVKNAANASAAGTVVEVTSANFDQEVLGSNLPVFVEFYAPNCPPCEQQAPLIQDAAKEYAGKVKFVRIDAVANPNIAANAGVYAVPTLFLLKIDEKVMVFNVGELTKEQLKQFIEHGLAAKNN